MTAVPGQLTSPPVALALAATVVTISVAIVALRNRSVPGAGWLAVVMVIDALVVSFAVGGYALPRTRQVALAVGGLGLLAAVPYVAFVVAYTGRGRHLTYWSLLGYGGPLFVAAALYATTGYHGLVLERPVGVHRSAGLTLLEYGGYGPLVAPALLYVALLVFGALLLVFQTVVRHERRFLGQSAALVVGALAPMAAALPAIGGFSRAAGATGPRSLMIASILMVTAGFALAYAAARHRLFEFVPAVRQLGTSAAVDDLDEGVLIVDEGENVVELNAAAAAVLDCDDRDVVGSSAASLFASVGVEDLRATPATFAADGGTFEVTSSPVTDERDRPIGRTFVIRDVTPRERRKQRLQVLNRVLRHNVRNDMSVVRMNAGVVAERGGDRLARLGENMVETADKLVAMGEKVRRSEQLLAADELADHDVDLPELLEEVVDGVRVSTDHAAVDATVAVGDGATVARANRSLLELALENVVENAVEHNDVAVPAVAVTADRVDDGVRLTVADDGPGIPDQELGALETGRETALQHASSLGLWLVHWSVERLGGDLHIEHLDPTGTAVSIVLTGAAADATRGAPADEAATPTDGSPSTGTAQTGGTAPGDSRVDDAAVAVVADGLAADDGHSTEPVVPGAGDSGSDGDDRSDAAGASTGVSASESTGGPADATGSVPTGEADGEPADDGDDGPSPTPLGTPRSRNKALPPPPPASAFPSGSDESEVDDDRAEAADDDAAGDSPDGTDAEEGPEADADGRADGTTSDEDAARRDEELASDGGDGTDSGAGRPP